MFNDDGIKSFYDVIGLHYDFYGNCNDKDFEINLKISWFGYLCFQSLNMRENHLYFP